MTPHKTVAITLALLLTALAAAHTPTRALPDTPEHATPVTLVTSLQGVKLTDALALLSASAGVNIITKDLPDKLVTYRFEAPQPFHAVLNTILALEDLTVTDTGAALIIQPAPSEQPATPSEREARFHDLEGAPANELTQIITALHPDAKAQTINDGARLLVTATPEQHAAIAELIADHRARAAKPTPEARFHDLGGAPADEAARIINTLHPTAATQAVNDGARLLITATPEQHEQIARLISDYREHAPKASGEPRNDTPVSAFIPVDRGLDEVTALARERFPDAAISPIPNAKALNVTAVPAELERVRAFVDEYQAFLSERERAGAIDDGEEAPMAERTYRVSNADASALATTIQSVLANRDDDRPVAFVADDRTNKLVVRAPEDLIPTVEELIAELDEPAKQVRVTVRIQEIAQREAENLGLTITANAGALVASLVNGAAQFVFNPTQALTALNINAVLDTLEGQSLSRTLDNAVLMVANNGTATLNSGGNINVAVQVGEGDTATQRSDSISFGTQVTITPRITNDGRVDLQIQTSVSGFEGELQNLTGLRFSDKSLNTNVVIGDKEVVVIGGLIQNSLTNTVQGVPVLSAIPVIGSLFKNDVTENNKSELLIVVTAEIVD